VQINPLGVAQALSALIRAAGLVAQLDGVTVAVLALDVAGDRIKHIWAILKPDKLRP